MLVGPGNEVGKGVTEGVPGPGVGEGVGVAVLEPAGIVTVAVWVAVPVAEAVADEVGDAPMVMVGVAEGDGRGVAEAMSVGGVGVSPGGG